MRTHWKNNASTSKNDQPTSIIPGVTGKPAYMNLLNYQTRNLEQKRFNSNDPSRELNQLKLEDTLDASSIHQQTLISINKLNKKCDKECPRERRLKLIQ